MTVQVSIKTIGQRKQRIKPIPFELSGTPKTVRGLITQTVTACVSEYEKRQQDNTPRPLTAQQITDMSDVGKIAFGINYGENRPDLQKAISSALQAFADGIYRVFLNDAELTSPEQEITLTGNDILTFVRLTQLAGRMY